LDIFNGEICCNDVNASGSFMLQDDLDFLF
jgi:hypothetical protein